MEQQLLLLLLLVVLLLGVVGSGRRVIALLLVVLLGRVVDALVLRPVEQRREARSDPGLPYTAQGRHVIVKVPLNH